MLPYKNIEFYSVFQRCEGFKFNYTVFAEQKVMFFNIFSALKLFSKYFLYGKYKFCVYLFNVLICFTKKVCYLCLIGCRKCRENTKLNVVASFLLLPPIRSSTRDIPITGGGVRHFLVQLDKVFVYKTRPVVSEAATVTL